MTEPMYQPTAEDYRDLAEMVGPDVPPTEDEMDQMAKDADTEAYGTALAFIGEPDREAAPDVADEAQPDDFYNVNRVRRPSAERGE